MRCLVAAIGSRGDVEPHTLLAEALAARGHQVVLCLDAGHHAGAREVAGVSRVGLGELGAEELAAIVARALAAPTPPERGRIALDGFWTHRRDALRARVVELATSGFGLVVLSEWLLFPEGDGFAWTAPTAVVFHVPAPRRDFVEHGRRPCLHLAAMSPVFAPDRDEEVMSRWRWTGFWIRQRAGGLDARTDAFLAAGKAPFLLTMGSMVGFDGPALVEAFVTAARRAGRRAIVQRGWAGLEAPSGDDVLAIDETDFAALFPRCAAVFTHGGTGTVAHALRAGRPIAFLPMVNDQLVWSATLQRMGNAVGAADPLSASADELGALMRRALGDPRPGQVASALAARLREEDGLATACAALEAHAAVVPVVIPSLGESLFQVRIVRWLKRPGDPVVEGEHLVEVATDKTDLVLDAPASGVVTAITAAEDEIVAIGAQVGLISLRNDP